MTVLGLHVNGSCIIKENVAPEYTHHILNLFTFADYITINLAYFSETSFEKDI